MPRQFLFIAIVGFVSIALTALFWGGVIAVAFHFVTKFW